MAKKRFKSIRPNAEGELGDVAEGDKLCEELIGDCQELEDENLDAFQEGTVTKAKEFAQSVQKTITNTGQFTEGQRQALGKWREGVQRVQDQLERRR